MHVLFAVHIFDCADFIEVKVLIAAHSSDFSVFETLRLNNTRFFKNICNNTAVLTISTSEMLSKLSTWTSTPTGMAGPDDKGDNTQVSLFLSVQAQRTFVLDSSFHVFNVKKLRMETHAGAGRGSQVTTAMTCDPSPWAQTQMRGRETVGWWKMKKCAVWGHVPGQRPL